MADLDPNPIVSAGLSQAERDVLRERRRQPLEEGFDAAHDDDHDNGELARAAACYAMGAAWLEMHRMGDGQGNIVDVPVRWPWAPAWWKPKSRRRDLVRAAGLLIAEIERLDRAADSAGTEADNSGEGADA